MTRTLASFVFLVGLAAIGWVGFGYLPDNPLALSVTALIGAFYLTGSVELRGFQRATTTLRQAVAGADAAPAELGPFLGKLHPSLQNAVRLRIEGERVGLPGPALAPYLTGLLVLLGMLGTFLGMVVTLKGTGMALESASDLQTIRSSLAAPVKGLGLAFGTSLAGVAASAMLGLLSALCRRDRLLAAQSLDARIATTLRRFTLAHHREATLALLQRQGDATPELVERLHAMADTLERQGQALHDRLAADQRDFQTRTEAAYGSLAASVDRSLQRSMTESARLASAAIQPVVEATMAGIAREAAALHGSVAHDVAGQLDGLSARFHTSTIEAARLWQEALEQHRRTSASLADELEKTLGGFVRNFESGSRAVVDGVAARLEETVDGISTRWQAALDRHEQVTETDAESTRAALDGMVKRLEHHGLALTGSVGAAHLSLQERLAAADQQRLQAWTEALQGVAATLQADWRATGAAHEKRQQDICDTLARTAREVSSQAETDARNTMAELSRLGEAAARAPQAAAELIAEMRAKLDASLARDDTMLEERSRLLGTLGTVLDDVNRSATEQREAIAGLVDASAVLLEQVGARFSERTAAETGKLSEIADRVGGSAIEVASLGEAFGLGVQLFSDASRQLGLQLESVQAALGKSTARSDEQLAYYVAQAREVVDLSILSQQQIVEDLQRLASQRADAGSPA